MAACTFYLNISKCKHQGGIKRIATFPNNWTVRDIHQQYHDGPHKDNKIECLGRIGGAGESGCGEGGVSVDWAIPLGDLKSLGVTALRFVCTATEAPSASKATATANAFDILLSGSRNRKLPAAKTRR